MVGAAISKVVHDTYPDISTNVENTGATNENIQLVFTGDATFGFGMCDDIVAAYYGEREYAGTAPKNNLRIVMAGYDQQFHFMTLADSGINGIEDFRGKRISCGPSGSPYFVPKFLEAAMGYIKDVDYKAQHLSHDQACDALVNGDIDVVIVSQGIPSAAYSSLSETYNIRFIGISDEMMERVLDKNPSWLKSSIPAGSYKGQNETLRVPSIPQWLFTNENVSEDVVYKVTDAIVRNTRELAMIHPSAGLFTLANARNGVILPFHPGADKRLNENGIPGS
jgi:TRAP transporter TAXI family solute receptor